MEIKVRLAFSTSATVTVKLRRKLYLRSRSYRRQRAWQFCHNFGSLPHHEACSNVVLPHIDWFRQFLAVRPPHKLLNGFFKTLSLPSIIHMEIHINFCDDRSCSGELELKKLFRWRLEWETMDASVTRRVSIFALELL